jgi:hypothetical protein
MNTSKIAKKSSPAKTDLFAINKASTLLKPEEKKQFHQTVDILFSQASITQHSVNNFFSVHTVTDSVRISTRKVFFFQTVPLVCFCQTCSFL